MKHKKFPITLLLDQVTGPANIGSIFRIADAFNIEKILLCGKNLELNSSRMRKTARATLEKVDFQVFENPKEAIKPFLDKKEFSIFALEITTDSVPIQTINFSEIEKMLLIIGNENYGISTELLEKAAQKIHINMFGQNSSMNVAQATGIALFEITKSISEKRKLIK